MDKTELDMRVTEAAKLIRSFCIACILLYQAVVECVQKGHAFAYPTNCFGDPCFVWAVEEERERPFACGLSNGFNDCGDYIQFMDFPINGRMVHHLFGPRTVNVLLDIAAERTGGFSCNDWTEAAELVRNGYVSARGARVWSNIPVYSQKQYNQILALFESTLTKMEKEIDGMLGIVSEILKSHMPSHLRKQEKDMVYLRLIEDVISAAIERLVNLGFLRADHQGDMLPTTYVVLNRE